MRIGRSVAGHRRLTPAALSLGLGLWRLFGGCRCGVGACTASRGRAAARGWLLGKDDYVDVIWHEAIAAQGERWRRRLRLRLVARHFAFAVVEGPLTSEYIRRDEEESRMGFPGVEVATCVGIVAVFFSVLVDRVGRWKKAADLKPEVRATGLRTETSPALCADSWDSSGPPARHATRHAPHSPPAWPSDRGRSRRQARGPPAAPSCRHGTATCRP